MDEKKQAIIDILYNYTSRPGPCHKEDLTTAYGNSKRIYEQDYEDLASEIIEKIY